MDIVFIMIFTISLGVARGTWENPERDTVRRILRDHEEADRYSRPVVNVSRPVWVSVGLVLNKVIGLDVNKEMLSFTAWNRLVWYDEYLPWNYTAVGVSSIRLPADKVWTPDVRSYNSLETDQYRPLVVVNADGLLLWVTQTLYSVPCGRTPEPTEWKCTLRLSSSVWDGSKLALHSMWHNVDTSSYESHGYVEILEASAAREVTYWPCCVQPYPSVVFTFLISVKK